MSPEVAQRLFERNLHAFARLLVKDEYLRREFMARVSCAMVQHGPHIDNLPINNPLPPIKFPPVHTGGGSTMTAAAHKLSVMVESFTPRRSNTLVGFCSVSIPELHLNIFDVAMGRIARKGRDHPQWHRAQGRARQGFLHADHRIH
jgi:hypothetical protein